MNFVVSGLPQQILSRIREVLNVRSPPTRSNVVHVKSKKHKINSTTILGEIDKDYVASRDLAFAHTVHGAGLEVISVHTQARIKPPRHHVTIFASRTCQAGTSR